MAQIAALAAFVLLIATGLMIVAEAGEDLAAPARGAAVVFLAAFGLAMLQLQCRNETIFVHPAGSVDLGIWRDHRRPDMRPQT